MNIQVTIPPGASIVEPGLVPSTNVSLYWDTFTVAAQQAGMCCPCYVSCFEAWQPHPVVAMRGPSLGTCADLGGIILTVSMRPYY
jgi:hypothetical protein